MTRAVLFDLDDTLFDHRHAARCVLEDLRGAHAALQKRTLAELEEEDYRLLSEKHVFVLAGSMTIPEARVQRVRELFARCGRDLTRGEAEELAERRRVVYRDSRRAVPGAIALLERLRRDARIGVVTNNLTEEQKDKMRACGLTDLVDVLVTSEEIGAPKPAAPMFVEALKRLGCRAGEAVMVGDTWESDIVGALNAGVRAVWLNCRGEASRGGDVAEIDSLEPAEVVARRILGGP